MKKTFITLCLAIVATTLAFGQQDVRIVPIFGGDAKWNSTDYSTDDAYLMDYNPVTAVYSKTLTLDKLYTGGGQPTVAGSKRYVYKCVMSPNMNNNATTKRFFHVNEDATTVTFYAKIVNNQVNYACDAEIFQYILESNPTVPVPLSIANGKTTATVNAAAGDRIQFQVRYLNGKDNENKAFEDGDIRTFAMLLGGDGKNTSGYLPISEGSHNLAIFFNSYELFLDAPADNNANLKSLTATGALFAPAFKPEITEYTAVLPYTAVGTNIVINANPFHPFATLTSGTGEQEPLVEGINTYSVVVTAPDETTQTYTINVKVASEGERLLVVKPLWATTQYDQQPEWCANVAYSTPYVMSKVEGYENLYKYTTTLNIGSKTQKYNADGRHGYTYTGVTNEGWTNVYQYTVVFQDTYGKINSSDNDANPNAASGKNSKGFTLTEDGTTVTFYALVDNGVIKSVCDAQGLSQWFKTGGSGITVNIDPAIGKPFAAATFTTDYASKIEMSVAADYYNPNGNTNANLGLYFTGNHRLVFDYSTFRYNIYKVVDGLQTPTLTIGANPVADLNAIPTLGTFHSATDFPLLGASTKGISTAPSGTPIDPSKVNTTLGYEIIAEGYDTGTVEKVALSASGNSTAVTWTISNVDLSDKIATLANGNYTLKFWYETDTYGDILKDDNDGNGYQFTFTVRNPITWTGNEDADWENPNNWSSGIVPTGDDQIIIPTTITDNAPSIPASVTVPVKTLTLDQNSELDVLGTLQITEAVKVNYVVSSGRWYAIGFPFEIDKVHSETWDADLISTEDGKNGHFWLKEYDGNTFNYKTKIEAGHGYIIQFPAGYVDETITFISKPIDQFSNGTGFTTSSNDVYQSFANPALKTLSVTPGQNQHYYTYNSGTNKFLRITNEETISPFESIISISTQANVRSFIGDGSDGTTEIESIDVPGIDPIIATRYYTVQGLEIPKPLENGVSIVKNIYASQKVEIVKIIRTQK